MKKQSNPNPPKGVVKPLPPPAPPARRFFMEIAQAERLVIQLRTLRPDLTEEKIIKEAQKFSEQKANCVLCSVLRGCIYDAMEGLPMEWEKTTP